MGGEPQPHLPTATRTVSVQHRALGCPAESEGKAEMSGVSQLSRGWQAGER